MAESVISEPERIHWPQTIADDTIYVYIELRGKYQKIYVSSTEPSGNQVKETLRLVRRSLADLAKKVNESGAHR